MNLSASNSAWLFFDSFEAKNDGEYSEYGKTAYKWGGVFYKVFIYKYINRLNKLH